MSTNFFLLSCCPCSSVQPILLEVDTLIFDWSHDFSPCPATHQLFGRGVVTLPFCLFLYVDFPFLRSRDCLFAQVGGCPGGGRPPVHLQLITSVPHGFRSQNTRAALIQEAVTPEEKRVEKLDGAPDAIPTTHGVGPSVPLWGCSLPASQKETSVPCEGTPRPPGSPTAARFAPRLLRESAGRGSGQGSALPRVRQDRGHGGPSASKRSNSGPGWNKPPLFQRKVLSPSRLPAERVPVI